MRNVYEKEDGWYFLDDDGEEVGPFETQEEAEEAELVGVQDSICGNCNDGWICESHPILPWEHGECDGAGTPCDCNPSGAVEFTTIITEVV